MATTNLFATYCTDTDAFLGVGICTHRQGDQEAAQVLLDAGADAAATDSLGRAASDMIKAVSCCFTGHHRSMCCCECASR